MFPPKKTPTLAQRALDVLRLTRSLLLLEDDREVDWEVDRDERARALHPHRAPLRGRLSERRPGQPIQRPQVCLCPVGEARPVSEPASALAALLRKGPLTAGRGRSQAHPAGVRCASPRRTPRS